MRFSDVALGWREVDQAAGRSGLPVAIDLPTGRFLWLSLTFDGVAPGFAGEGEVVSIALTQNRHVGLDGDMRIAEGAQARQIVEVTHQDACGGRAQRDARAGEPRHARGARTVECRADVAERRVGRGREGGEQRRQLGRREICGPDKTTDESERTDAATSGRHSIPGGGGGDYFGSDDNRIQSAAAPDHARRHWFTELFWRKKPAGLSVGRGENTVR